MQLDSLRHWKCGKSQVLFHLDAILEKYGYGRKVNLLSWNSSYEVKFNQLMMHVRSYKQRKIYMYACYIRHSTTGLWSVDRISYMEVTKIPSDLK
jgi:hypothetical protein